MVTKAALSIRHLAFSTGQGSKEPGTQNRMLNARANHRFAVSKPRMNFVQSLIAVVAGNLLYFFLMPHLPPPARHTLGKMDLGVLVDFWFCVVFLGAIKTFTKWGRVSRQQQR